MNQARSITRASVLLSTLALFALIVTGGLAHAQEGGEEDAAKAGGLPAGWSKVDPSPGRKNAVMHEASLARMESWSARMPQEGVESFLKTFEARLANKGYSPSGTDEVNVKGYTATLRQYTQQVGEAEVTLSVVEVYRRGVLWQFSSIYRPTEEATAEVFEKALLGFASGHL